MTDAYSLTSNQGLLDNGIYANNSIFIYAVYSVSAGNVSVQKYDEFVPNN